MKNIGIKKNDIIIDLEDTKKLTEMSLYERIQKERQMKSHKIERLKILYVQYFLKNIEKIKTQTFNRVYNLDFIDDDKIEDSIQQQIFKEMKMASSKEINLN